MNALVMLSSSCKGKVVKISMTVTVSSLPLPLNTLSTVSLKKISKKKKFLKKNIPQNPYEINNTFSNISSPWIKRKITSRIITAIKGKFQESKCRVKLLQILKESRVSSTE